MKKWLIFLIILLLLFSFLIILLLTGGTDDFRRKIGSTSFPSDIPELNVVRQYCAQYCDIILSSNIQPEESQYCIHKFKLDLDNDKKADKLKENYKAYYCGSPEINLPCAVKCSENRSQYF